MENNMSNMDLQIFYAEWRVTSVREFSDGSVTLHLILVCLLSVATVR